MIARNDDSGSGHFTAKKFTVFQPQDYPAVYKSVISGVEIPLPGSGLRITAVPNAVEGKGLVGGQRRQRGQRRHDGYRDHHLQPARAGR